ncbi:Cytochrome P450 94C1 [Linum grandiflorum]
MDIYSFTTAFTFLFFSFTAAFTVFSIILGLLRPTRWCSCHLCSSYLSATWRSQFNNLSDWYSHLLSAAGPSATIRIHVLRNVITANPSNVHHILKSNFPNYPKGKPFSSILGDLLGDGIFNVDGHRWLFQRKIAILELGSLSVRAFASEVISSQINSYLLPLLSAAAAGDAGVDMQDVLRRFSFDTIFKFSFGLDPGCLEKELSIPVSEFAAAFDEASKLSAERAMAASPAVWKTKRFFRVGSERRLEKAIRMVNRVAQEVINQRRKIGVAGKSDLLSRFMAAGVGESENNNNDEYLRDIVKSFMLAGRDTVASGLTSFFWLMSRHPEAEAAIRAEAESAAAAVAAAQNDDNRASFDRLREMHYLTAAVYESLRLFPPVQFDSKFALNDDVLPDGTVVRKGDRVTYHPYAMGRMESIWGADCMEFRPERWLNEEGRFVGRSQFEYPVFQGGHRVCLGKEMAIVEMKSVILAVVTRFNVRVADPGQEQMFSPGLTATVRGGLKVVVQRRASEQ